MSLEKYKYEMGGSHPPRMFKKPTKMWFEFFVGNRNDLLVAKYHEPTGNYLVYRNLECREYMDIGGFNPNYFLSSPHDAFINWINGCYLRGGLRVWEDSHYYIREENIENINYYQNE